MTRRPCIIGLDAPEISALKAKIAGPLIAHETLPRILVRDGNLFVESPAGFGLVSMLLEVYGEPSTTIRPPSVGRAF
jgi:hypothetical protein